MIKFLIALFFGSGSKRHAKRSQKVISVFQKSHNKLEIINGDVSQSIDDQIKKIAKAEVERLQLIDIKEKNERLKAKLAEFVA